MKHIGINGYKIRKKGESYQESRPEWRLMPLFEQQ